MWNNSVKWKQSINLDELMANFEFEERDKVAKAGWQMCEYSAAFLRLSGVERIQSLTHA